MLTIFNTAGHVVRALRAGAAGFLIEDTPPEEIVDAGRGPAPHRAGDGLGSRPQA